MHLLNARTLELETFLDDAKRPAYAILSHTWGDEEVLYQDLKFSPPETFNSKKGYFKIWSASIQALEDGLDYAWVDTCCIDKTSSAELSEAINSMFNWYRDAKVCYAYLEDVGFLNVGLELLLGPQLPPATIMSIPEASLTKRSKSFVESRWFTRGWTLQELLAPRRIVFYSRNWEYIGMLMDLETRHAMKNNPPNGRLDFTRRRISTGPLDMRRLLHLENRCKPDTRAKSIDDGSLARSTWTRQPNSTAPNSVLWPRRKVSILDLSLDEWSLVVLISHATRIPVSVVANREDFRHSSVAKRMSWAASRQTTRKEDEAYSLLGIFDVNMPLLYGEGAQAFGRLQKEIMNSSNDHTLFAWTRHDEIRQDGIFRNHAISTIMAPDLKCFYGCHYLNQKYADVREEGPNGFEDSPYHATASGIEITLPLHDSRLDRGLGPAIAVLHCYDERWPSRLIVLVLWPRFPVLLFSRSREFIVQRYDRCLKRLHFSRRKLIIRDITPDSVSACKRLYVRLNAAPDLALHARVFSPKYAWDASALTCVARPKTRVVFIMDITSSSQITTSSPGHRLEDSYRIYILVEFDSHADPTAISIGSYHGEDPTELSENARLKYSLSIWTHKLTDDMYVAVELLLTSMAEPPIMVVNVAHGSAFAAKTRARLELMAKWSVISMRRPWRNWKLSVLELSRVWLVIRDKVLDETSKAIYFSGISPGWDTEETQFMPTTRAKERRWAYVRIQEALQFYNDAFI